MNPNQVAANRTARLVRETKKPVYTTTTLDRSKRVR